MALETISPTDTLKRAFEKTNANFNKLPEFDQSNIGLPVSYPQTGQPIYELLCHPKHPLDAEIDDVTKLSVRTISPGNNITLSLNPVDRKNIIINAISLNPVSSDESPSLGGDLDLMGYKIINDSKSVNINDFILDTANGTAQLSYDGDIQLMTDNGNVYIDSIGTVSINGLFLSNDSGDAKINTGGNLIIEPSGNINLNKDTYASKVIANRFEGSFYGVLHGSLSSPITLINYTTDERDSISATNGMMIYNTDLNKFQGFSNNVWVDLS